MKTPVIALLGRKDEPTDAVEEYCKYLGAALEAYDFELQIRRVPWEKHGWREALHALRLQASGWEGTWVLLQYTALAWSKRGFPHQFRKVVSTLKKAGVKTAIVFHDVHPYAGNRWQDRVRRWAQLSGMRSSLSLADVGIFTVALERVAWISKDLPKANFIPVGPNLPVPEEETNSPREKGLPSIAVFSITGGEAGGQESGTIVAAVEYAAKRLGRVRLNVFGRHAELRETELRNGLRDVPVELEVQGVMSPELVVAKMQESDVLLFVRGPISSRRGSAIAGIACGLPVIACAGAETAPPIDEAGVIIVSSYQPAELGNALVRVLSDGEYRAQMSARSRTAFRDYFSWPAIAASFSRVLNGK